jgi:hypothetical protein
VRAVFTKLAGICLYLGSVAGLCVLGAHLSVHLAAQAVALGSPYFTSPSPRPLSLVERRQIDAAQVAVSGAKPEIVEPMGEPPTAPSIPPQILAAQLDLSESVDLPGAQSPARRSGPSRLAAVARPVHRSAADVFGRSFGVLTVVSR